MNTMNVANFLIITGCALSFFAVFYINRQSFSNKPEKDQAASQAGEIKL